MDFVSGIVQGWHLLCEQNRKHPFHTPTVTKNINQVRRNRLFLSHCSSQTFWFQPFSRSVAATRGGEELISEQNLFSVYVHAPEDYQYPKGSLFNARKVDNPVDTMNAFAQFALVEAQIRMLEAALEDSLNQKFVMLSETTIPLHPPEIVYLQLVHESKSRVSACAPRRGWVETLQVTEMDHSSVLREFSSSQGLEYCKW